METFELPLDGVLRIEFKSYYVVWKLVGRKYIFEQVIGLNRTM